MCRVLMRIQQLNSFGWSFFGVLTASFFHGETYCTFTITKYLTDPSKFWVTEVKVITQPHKDIGFVAFPQKMPVLAVYQMSCPKLPFLRGNRWIEKKPFSDCLGCTLLLTALHQMRVPTDRDYRSKMKKSLKLSPGFAQKTTRDIMLYATLLFLLCCKCSVLREQMKSVRLLKLHNEPL